MNDFKSRKAARTKYFFENIFKRKLITCSACNGSGWYDGCGHNGESIPCGGCDGKGKVRQ